MFGRFTQSDLRMNGLRYSVNCCFEKIKSPMLLKSTFNFLQIILLDWISEDISQGFSLFLLVIVLQI